MQQQQISHMIYVLDDDLDVRESLSALLKSCDFSVQTFSHSDGFLAACAQKIPDCAIVDIKMPGVSGLELLGILKQREMSVPVVIITGHGSINEAVMSMKLGAVDVLQKPFGHQKLLDTIDQALRTQGKQSLVEKDMGPYHEGEQIKLRLAKLSSREREILDLIVLGKSSKEIADQLNISVATVNNHRTQIKNKMEAKTVAHLLAMINQGVNAA